MTYEVRVESQGFVITRMITDRRRESTGFWLTEAVVVLTEHMVKAMEVEMDGDRDEIVKELQWSCQPI